MDFMSLLREYQALSIILVSAIITAIAMKYWWEEVSFYFLRIFTAMPVFGKVARLSKDIDNADKDSWFHSEKTLCSSFLPHYQSVDKDAAFYDKCTSYLSKARETGRDELHLFGWFLVSAMVFVEAMGFSYVLAGYTVPGASESVQQYGAVGLAFLISGLLVFFTHRTGAELHENELIRKVRAWHNHADGKLIPEKQIKLANDEKDDDSPTYQQLLNRLEPNPNVTPTYYITTGTIIFVLLVAIGATYVRGMVLEADQTRETQYGQTSQDEGVYKDPYNEPNELEAIAVNAETKAQEEVRSSEKKGGWATFIILAVIFVFLQIMGVLIGFFKDFAGIESKSARHYIGKFKTREQFAAYYDRKRNKIAQIAQKNLSDLQQKMARRAQKSSADGTLIQQIVNYSDRNFLAFVDMESKSHRPVKEVQTFTAESQPLKSQPEQIVVTKSEDRPAVVEKEETLEQRIERIKSEKQSREPTPEQKMAAMSDEELENYLISTGALEK